MGPSHPSTHGVLRIILDLDGELITRAIPDIGYLHRGDEKIAENMQYNQFVPYTDRLDYLAPIANNVAYALAVEKLMGWEIPARGKAIRVICCELARISSHMLGIGCMAMDIGAVTVFMYTFTEREKIYNLVEQLSGARFTTSYTRVGRPDPRPARRASSRSSRNSSARSSPVDRRSRQAAHPQHAFSSDRCKDVGIDFQGRRHRLRHLPARTCAAPVSSTTCAASIPISTTRNTISRSRWAPSATATTATSSAWKRCARAFVFSSR